MNNLEQWLMEDGLVSHDQLEHARRVQEDRGIPLSMALIELEVLTETDLVDLVARRYGMPKAPRRLHKLTIAPKALNTIPQDHCWQHGVFPFGIDMPSKTLQVAILDPKDPEAVGLLQRLPSGLEADLYVAGPRQLEKAIRKHFLDSIVEDTNAPALRFFGYDGFTNPGIVKRDSPAEPDLDDIVLAEPDTSPPVAAAAPLPEPALPGQSGQIAAIEQAEAEEQQEQEQKAATPAPENGSPIKAFPTVKTLEDRPSGKDEHRAALARIGPDNKEKKTSFGIGPDVRNTEQIEALTRRVAALERALMNLLQLTAQSTHDLSDKTERIAGSLGRDMEE